MAIRPATMAPKLNCWAAEPLVGTVTGLLGDAVPDAYTLVATVEAVGYGATGVVGVVGAGASGLLTGEDVTGTTVVVQIGRVTVPGVVTG